MKRIVLLSILLITTVCIDGQLSGDFYKNRLTGQVFFMLDNYSPYPINFMWSAVNYEKKEEKENYCTILPYQRLSFGPNIGWWWEAGEYFFVVSNTQRLKFRCEMTDPTVPRRSRNPSFKSDGWSSVSKSAQCKKCRNCKTYKGYKRDGLEQYSGACSNISNEHKCGHGPADHGLTEY